MRLADWRDANEVSARLRGSGMSAECATAAASCFAECAAALEPSITTDAPIVACWAPGRIEVLGKHTDYCGGESILAAVERGFALLAAARTDNVIRLLNVRSGEACEFPLDVNIEPPLGHWSNYPQTVARRVARNFPVSAKRGATIAFSSNLPPSAGMSSSSAFVVGTFLLLSQINNLPQDAAYRSSIRSVEELAGYLGSVENGGNFGALAGDRGVGTFGGSEDHTAILLAQPNRLVQYAYCPVRFRRTIELADDYVVAIASSGVVAEKTGAALEKYNRISAMVCTIVSTWQSATGRDELSLAAILETAPNAIDKLRHVLATQTTVAFSSDDLIERLDHFTTERRLIRLVPDTINAATIGEFGEIAYESHRIADRYLKNQTAETNRLVEIAQQLGAPAASAFGAGFGGSVWALVNQPHAALFQDEWQTRYRREFPKSAERSEFFVSKQAAPASAGICD